MEKIDINNYQQLIHHIIAKFNLPISVEKSEIYNECYLQLSQLVDKYDSAKGNFQTYAYQRLYYCCVDYLQTNSINHTSLNELIGDYDNQVELAELIPDTSDLRKEIEDSDFLNKHNKNLSDVELFIQQKYYYQHIPVKAIIKVYFAYHQIKSEKTIRKILKK